MKIATAAALVIISVLAVATVIANAQMHSSASLYSVDSATESPFREMMQNEMNGLLELQGKYSSGQVTGEQYRLEMEGYCRSMTEIHKEFASSGMAGLLKV